MAKDTRPSISKVFSGRLLVFRKLRGMSQEELAEKANISRGAIATFENGTRWPRVETVAAIADALEVSEIELFQNEPPESIKNLSRIITELSEALDVCERKIGQIPPDLLNRLEEVTPQLWSMVRLALNHPPKPVEKKKAQKQR